VTFGLFAFLGTLVLALLGGAALRSLRAAAMRARLPPHLARLKRTPATDFVFIPPYPTKIDLRRRT
jgi:hypothetical protein